MFARCCIAVGRRRDLRLSFVPHEPQIPLWCSWGSYRRRSARHWGFGHWPVQGARTPELIERAWRLPVAVTFKRETRLAIQWVALWALLSVGECVSVVWGCDNHGEQGPCRYGPVLDRRMHLRSHGWPRSRELIRAGKSLFCAILAKNSFASICAAQPANKLRFLLQRNLAEI